MDGKTIADVAAEMRAKMAPGASDPYALRTQCATCPTRFWRRAGSKTKHCPACAHERQRQATEEMARKAGPTYERAVRKQFAFWAAEMARLGLTTDQPE
jgi:hypothetical protein